MQTPNRETQPEGMGWELFRNYLIAREERRKFLEGGLQMDIEQEKRMAGNYEIIHALHIGDREIVLGETHQRRRMSGMYARSASSMRYSQTIPRSWSAMTTRNW